MHQSTKELKEGMQTHTIAGRNAHELAAARAVAAARVVAGLCGRLQALRMPPLEPPATLTAVRQRGLRALLCSALKTPPHSITNLLV